MRYLFYYYYHISLFIFISGYYLNRKKNDTSRIPAPEGDPLIPPPAPEGDSSPVPPPVPQGSPSPVPPLAPHNGQENRRGRKRKSS